MARCRKIANIKRELCVGSLRHRVTIVDRSLRAPTFSNKNYTIEHSNGRAFWASFKTSSGLDSFDGINIEGAVTHVAYIRYNPSANINAQDLLQFKGRNFDILSVENLEERNEWLRLNCVELGENTESTR